MNIKFKISIPVKNKMLNWRCNLHFHYDLKELKKQKHKQRNAKSNKNDMMKKMKTIENDLNIVNY